ncbi:homocysteine-responsive endoplasmic reticulum-resident ubiquitin-like domain member 2 protein [Drosophila santomea]|uniref:homocysteine-responsive endoplasmic reticulum-resident ubiquitin-like domain member 2 protein n=1 Tax=Drosophila santomea TaxID=129105 RepID=UPI0019545D26|nr:homocysteine-responsive endoplasmic reticulum-resident ubiquitin-like domain member 2 protein [Drosophila santomea]
MEENAAPPAAATAAGCDAATRQKNPETSVRLLIKSSNQQYEDLNVDSDLCWTVQRLKKQLSLIYPGKPKIQDQKLIYSGKLLDDAQKISEVIRSYKDVYQQHHIFHLVCASKQVITPPVQPATVPQKDAAPAGPEVSGIANELRQRHPTHQQQSQQGNAASPVAGDIGLANPWTQFWQQNQGAAAAANASASASPQVLLQQQALIYNAWMQQAYAQYMQQLTLRATLSGSNESGLAPPSQPLLPTVPLIAVPQPVAGAAADPAAQVPVAPQINAAPQNRNFPNIQEEPEMRDWLDSFFSFTRLAIFVTVLYFNSSPLRCLLVLLIAGAIYLYHIGVLRRRRERNNNNINRNNNADDAAAFAAVQQIQRMMDAAVERENNDPQAANEPGAVPAAGPAAAAGQDAIDAPVAAAPPVGAPDAPASAANPDPTDVSAEAVAVEPPNANNSVISVVRTFVITFFTSLLPEAPAL